MKVNLDINNRNKTIEFHYKKIKGTITINYIDDETGEIIESKILSDLELGEHEILPKDIEGYELIKDEIEYEEDIKEEEKIEISNIDRLNAIRNFVKDMEEL